MQLDGNGFFGDLKELFEENNKSFFKTDIKTILGRNIVKNFIGKINFEIGMFGYSDTANEIAEFYSECLKNGGIISFLTNPVVRMILEEIKYIPKVKSYLKDRIFDDIEREKVEILNKIFENNEDIKEKLDKENKDFVKQKMLREKEINKIMKQNKCTREQAEELYEKLQIIKKNQEIIPIPLPIPNICGTGIDVKDSLNLDECFKKTFEKQFKNNEDVEKNIISLDEEDKEIETPFTDNDSFWS